MGKKRQFDEEDVLLLIAEYFWKHGYHATKVDRLSEITGLTKTSIYNAFGNKEALFARVVEFYVEKVFHPALQQLDTRRPMSDNLGDIFALYFVEENNRYLSHGCLLTNSILELADNEPQLYAGVVEQFDQLLDAMRRFFAEYADSGRLASGVEADELAEMFMTFIQGLRVQSRNPNPADRLHRSIHMFLELMKSLESGAAHAA